MHQALQHTIHSAELADLPQSLLHSTITSLMDAFSFPFASFWPTSTDIDTPVDKCLDPEGPPGGGAYCTIA